MRATRGRGLVKQISSNLALMDDREFVDGGGGGGPIVDIDRAIWGGPIVGDGLYGSI